MFSTPETSVHVLDWIKTVKSVTQYANVFSYQLTESRAAADIQIQIQIYLCKL